MKTTLALAALLAITGFYFSRPEISPGKEVANVPIVNQPKIELEKVPEISLSTFPQNIIQGEPLLVTINGTTTVKSLTFKGKPLYIFTHDGKLSALIGIDLREIVGTYPLVATLTDGNTIKTDLVVGKRIITTAPMGIPDKLGGNTPESEKNLSTTLVQEANIINSIPTVATKLWEGTFAPPIENPVVTDVYGYSRLTGASTFAHKGTDFRASVGTPVYAMNSGTVRYTGFLRNYGNAVVIDHGLGLQTIYMHLSEVSVKDGESVVKGQLLGKSGDTGYVMGPHLHVSVKINKISIDPMKFLELLGVKYWN